MSSETARQRWLSTGGSHRISAVSLRGEASVGPPLSREQWLRLAMRYLDEKTARTYASRKSWESITIRVRPTKIVEFPGIPIA